MVDDSDDSDDEDDWECEHCHLVFNQEFGSMGHYRFCNVLNNPHAIKIESESNI